VLAHLVFLCEGKTDPLESEILEDIDTKLGVVDYVGEEIHHSKMIVIGFVWIRSANG
jgi:hypothetical protein